MSKQTKISPVRSGKRITRTRVAVIIDHGFLRELVVALFADKKDRYRVILQAEEKELITETGKLHENDLPHIVIIAATFSQLNTNDTVHYIRTTYQKTIKIMVLALQYNIPYITQMINRGVDAYLPHTAKPADFFYAIDNTLSKGYFYPGTMDDRLLLSIREGLTSFEGDWSLLSITEKKMMQLLCSDKTYSEIAAQLGITYNQARYYGERLHRLFKVKSRIDLILLMFRNKMLDEWN